MSKLINVAGQENARVEETCLLPKPQLGYARQSLFLSGTESFELL